MNLQQVSVPKPKHEDDDVPWSVMLLPLAVIACIVVLGIHGPSPKPAEIVHPPTASQVRWSS